MNLKFYKILILLFILSSTIGITTSNAQFLNRKFDFTYGDEYIKNTKVTSTGVVERGNQNMVVNTISTVKKAIKVTDSSETGYGFKITIEEMDNQIETLDKKVSFSSTKPVDPSSKLEKALRYMIDKPVELRTDKNGIILSTQDPTRVLANDTLLAFAGIQPEFFERGDLFTLVGDFIYDDILKKGYSWSDSLVIDDQKMVTDYVIDEINEKSTVIKLKTASYGRLINSNTNATYIVDNKSGIILEKLIYTVSTGFRVSNKLLYAISRSSSIVETIVKKETSGDPPN